MFTKRQTAFIERLSGKSENDEDLDAPHLSELSGALTRAFGGVDKLAEMLANLANDPAKPDWLRTRAAGLVVNSIAAASKLAENEPLDSRMPTEAELKFAAKAIFREVLGVTDAMENDLQAVVAAWPELSAATREGIVTAINAVNTERAGELQ